VKEIGIDFSCRKALNAVKEIHNMTDIGMKLEISAEATSVFKYLLIVQSIFSVLLHQ
jgi:hypothetical protein